MEFVVAATVVLLVSLAPLVLVIVRLVEALLGVKR